MNFTVITAAQGTDDWFAARCGRVTGSKASCVLAGEKTATRADYRLQLAVERITGKPETFDFTNAHMQHGTETEPEARLSLEAVRGIMIRETGFCSHNALMIGASLDGDIDDFASIVELKCPKSTTHIGYLEDGKLPTTYRAQVMHNLYVTGARSALFASYDSRVPDGLQLFIVEVSASDLPIDDYEKSLMAFLSEVSAMEDKLQSLRSQSLLKKAA